MFFCWLYKNRIRKKMSEISLVYGGKVVHSGIFDFKDVYRFLYEWFMYYSYVVMEKKYSEKIKAEGKDIEIEWTCLRNISDYFRFRVKVTVRVMGMITVDVMRNGIKTKRDKGEIEINFSSGLERDYENKWETSPIIKFLRGLYDKYIIKTRIEAYEDRLGVEKDEIIAQIKSYLALEGKR